MSYWYERENEGSWVAILLVGAVAGAMVVGLAWLGTWWLASPGPEPQQSPVSSQEAVGEPAAESSEVSQPTSDLDRCRTVYDAQSDPLQAAAASITQWEVHIGAMNKLVVGAITLRQARQFWNETREGAHAKLHHFATAKAGYDQRVYRCTMPARASEARPLLRSCHRAVTARGQTIRLGTVALERWKRHVHHMEMLKSGEMSPQRATRLWLRDWQAGDREVQAYRAAARTRTGQAC